MSHTLKLVTAVGQIKHGDALIIYDGRSFTSATAKIIINEGLDTEEVVFRVKRNKYFIVSMYLRNKSWAKEVYTLVDTTKNSEYNTQTNSEKE